MLTLEYPEATMASQGQEQGIVVRHLRANIALWLVVLLSAAVTPRAIAQTYTVLYHFAGPPGDGSGPIGPLVLDNAGNLYGATSQGGSGTDCPGNGCGAIFKFEIAARKETILYNFTGGFDGTELSGGLVRDPGGNLYGVAFQAGDPHCNCGTVYKLDPTNKLTVLYTFTGGSDGGLPFGRLVSVNGELYGVTQGLSSTDFGEIFKVSKSGNFSVVYKFTGGADGNGPQELIRDDEGNLYGATVSGGNLACIMSSTGCGVIFKMDTSGHFSVLYSFPGGAAGWLPRGRLIRDVNGNIHGVTQMGGDIHCQPPNGCGTVYRLDPNGKEKVLHAFPHAQVQNGRDPTEGLLDVAGLLFGSAGGGDVTCQPTYGCGIVFELGRNTSDYTVVHAFTGGSDGVGAGELIEDSSGNIYGPGGSFGIGGTLFMITP